MRSLSAKNFQDPRASAEPSWRTVSFARERKPLLRVGVVGLGRQALEDHLPGLQTADSVDLVAVCDENPEAVREQQTRHYVPGYTDFRQMFNAEKLDLVGCACRMTSVGW